MVHALNHFFFPDTRDRIVWRILLLRSLLDLCFLPPLKLRLGELLRDTTALEPPELDEWTASITLCKFVHIDLELAYKVLVAVRMAVTSKKIFSEAMGSWC